MFSKEKEVEDKNSEDITPSFSDLEYMIWLMKNSVFYKNHILGQAERFYYENEDFIKKDIMRNREKVGKSTPV